MGSITILSCQFVPARSNSQVVLTPLSILRELCPASFSAAFSFCLSFRVFSSALHIYSLCTSAAGLKFLIPPVSLFFLNICLIFLPYISPSPCISLPTSLLFLPIPSVCICVFALLF